MISTAALTRIWIALLGLTLVEVALALPQFSPVVFLVILLALSLGKSVMIMRWFMHLKLERRSLTLILFPFLVVCILLLCIFLPDAQRLKDLRP